MLNAPFHSLLNKRENKTIARKTPKAKNQRQQGATSPKIYKGWNNQDLEMKDATVITVDA